MTVNHSRRRLLHAAAAAGLSMTPFYGPWKTNRVFAAAKPKPLTIGLLHAATGQYGVSGLADKRGSIMAIEQANAAGGVLGREVRTVWMDTQTKPHLAAANARRFITENEVAFLSGAVHSNVASAVADVAQEFGCIYLNTNSSSSAQAGADCRRVKFVFDANGYNFARATIGYARAEYGRRWILLINDYSWGHNTAAAIRAQAVALGAEIIEEILVPIGTRNYIAILKKIADHAPDVVATAIGGDDYIPLRAQAVDMGLRRKPAWLNNQQDWPDHIAINEASLFGLFSTTWYHRLELPGVAEFVARYRQRWPDHAIAVPGNVFYNGYMAMRELLSAVERVGSTHNIAVIKALEQLRVSAVDRLQHHDAFMNPQTHHLQQTVYMASNNPDRRTEHDLYRVLKAIPPQQVAQASTDCQLESYYDTPSYER